MTVSGGPAGQPGAAGPDTRHLQAIAAVTALTAALVAPLASAWAALTGTLDRLTAEWSGEPASVRVRRARGFAAQAAVLLTPLDEAVAADADDAVARVFNAASAAAAVDTGAGWVASRADRRVLDAAAADLTADLRTAIAYTLTTARALARQVERLADADGPVAEQAGALERALADRGLAAVVYRDGSRHALDEYARMATRTKLAQTWQIAGLRLMTSAGVTYAEVADGPSCGWTSHTDPDKADGKIVTIDEALAYPLAHPRCVRTTYPRTDVRSADEAQVAPRLGRGRLLADDGGDAPSVRDGSGLLDVRSPAVLSPAAGRHAASVARALARTVPVAGVGVVRATLKRRATPVQGPGQP